MKNVRNDLVKLGKHLPKASLWLFGSFVNGKENAPDIDVGIRTSQDVQSVASVVRELFVDSVVEEYFDYSANRRSATCRQHYHFVVFPEGGAENPMIRSIMNGKRVV